MSDVSAADDFEIEVVDELEEAVEPDKVLPDEADVTDDGDDLDDEISSYSENVQKRIKQLTFEKHEERRKLDEAEKVREEAVRYAESVTHENQRLQALATRGESVAVSEASSRVDTSIEAAQKKYKDAFETGDTDALVEAQTDISGLQVEKARLSAYTPPPPQQQQQRQQAPDPRAMEWKAKNTWFDTDVAMRSAAIGIHNEIAMTGYYPGSDVYYTELDRRLRDAFPQKFDQIEDAPDGSQEAKKPRSRSPGNVVAPAGRSGKTSQKIQLTATQVSLAKRLGITPEQYAAQMMKDMKNAD